MHVSFCHSVVALLQTAIPGQLPQTAIPGPTQAVRSHVAPLAVQLTVAQEPSSILSPSSQTVGLDLNTDPQWE